MKLEVVRYFYNPNETVGEMSIDGTFFAYTLEDKVRPPGVKVPNETAIPEGIYFIETRPFRGDNTKIYPHLLNVPMFTGVCIHGGNDADDTEGCILIGFNKLQDTDGEYHKIYNSAIGALVSRIMAQPFGESIVVSVRNGG